MKIRQHRGGFTESMATVVDIEPTPQAIASHINKIWAWLLKGETILPDAIHVEKYGIEAIDTRNGWSTYIVTVDGHGVFGMTDGPVEDN